MEKFKIFEDGPSFKNEAICHLKFDFIIFLSTISIDIIDKFMKLTTKSEYSILALIYIARNDKNKFIKIEEICGIYNISKKYLESLFAILKTHRYLKTKRGSSGGYKLAIPVDKITVASIVRLMDGALAPSESVSKYFFSETPLQQEQKMIVVLKDIRNYIAFKLEHLTLAD